MTISVYDPQNAPRWVRFINVLNLFLLGFFIGKVMDVGFDSTYVSYFTLYGCLYSLIVGSFFMPKKKVQFPTGFILHLKDQWFN